METAHFGGFTLSEMPDLKGERASVFPEWPRKCFARDNQVSEHLCRHSLTCYAWSSNEQVTRGLTWPIRVSVSKLGILSGQQAYRDVFKQFVRRFVTVPCVGLHGLSHHGCSSHCPEPRL